MAKDNDDFEKLTSTIKDEDLEYFDRMSVEIAESRQILARDYSHLPIPMELVSELKEAARNHIQASNAVLEAHDAADRSSKYPLWGKVLHKVLDFINFLSHGALERSKFIQNL